MITIGILFFNENELEIYRIFRSLKRQVDKDFCLIITVEPRVNGLMDFEIFKEFKGLKIIENKNIEGTVKNRNKIVSECKSEYLVFIDGDDFVDRNFVREINSSILTLAHLYFYNYKIVKNKKKTLIDFKNINIIKESLKDWKIIGCSVYRIDIFEEIGGFINNSFEDVELMLRMISSGFTNFKHIKNTKYYWIKKETGRNSNVKSLDYAYLMKKHVRLFMRYNDRNNFKIQFTNVFNIFLSERKYFNAIIIAIRANLIYMIFSRIRNKFFKK